MSIIAELNKPLDRSVVKTRNQAGFDLSYIEGWWAISEANRIFGFDGWSRETIYCKEVCQYEYKGKNDTKMNKVGYEAKVLIRAFNDDKVIIREGTGHGSGNAKDLFDAIEGAAKEAETDAMKRALMTFGNPFGLALYDKTQANVKTIVEMITLDQATELSELMLESKANASKLFEYYKCTSLDDMPKSIYHRVKGDLEKKIDDNSKGEKK